MQLSYSAKEVEDICRSEQDRLVERLNGVAKIPTTQATFKNAFLAVETITTEFNNAVNPAIFMKDVSPEEKVRDAAGVCAEQVGQLFISLFAREDLYKVLKAASENDAPTTNDEMRLVHEVMQDFKRNGLDLPEKERAIFVEKKKQIVTRQESFQKRIRDMTKNFVVLEEKELKGLSPDFIKGLQKTEDGKYKVGMDKATVLPFLENAANSGARRKVDLMYNQLGGPENVKDFEETVKLRHETAQMLGFKTHAHYVLDRQMAQNPDKVFGFLNPLVDKLKVKGTSDLAMLTSLKKEDEPNDPTIHAWDWRYYANVWKKKKFEIDSQAIKEYFPLDTVLKGMFEIYQTLLGVQFVEKKPENVWHTSVKKFEIVRNGKVVANFYMDLFPREGKYNHFAAFDIQKAYLKADGTYSPPISAIVGNFTPPSADLPSLLEHDEVETMFHEFGHIMHQTLTNAKYAYFSGTSVKTDFVEAPSQMLENWVWEPAPLEKLSGHYQNPSKKLPKALVDKMIQAKLVNVGIAYLRQASFALIDMKYHTSASIDGQSTQIYTDYSKNVMLIPIQEGTIPQAGFGHLMGGYDSGYYGYLWSKVFAQDMFTRFEKEGLLNPKTGQDYLTLILEPGGVPNPMDQITKFLGREPNQVAFLKSLGISDKPASNVRRITGH